MSLVSIQGNYKRDDKHFAHLMLKVGGLLCTFISTRRERRASACFDGALNSPQTFSSSSRNNNVTMKSLLRELSFQHNCLIRTKGLFSTFLFIFHHFHLLFFIQHIQVTSKVHQTTQTQLTSNLHALCASSMN